MHKDEIWISECFHSIQGEGPETGSPTVFVRVFACNMNPPCPWCDSMYAVQKVDDTAQRVPVEAVVNKIREFDCKDVTFTGGEPLMYIEQMYSIMKILTLTDEYKFHFETNGLITPPHSWTDEFDVTFAVSPKLHAIEMKPDTPLDECDAYIGKLRSWGTFFKENMILKFVYEGEETIEKLEMLNRLLMSSCSRVDTYLMPEGNEFDQKKYQECADQCLKHGYKMSARLHNVIWGSKRGV